MPPLILIVDDSRLEAALIETLFQGLGYRTRVVHNGEDGIAAAREHRPALVVMDVIMPGMNGFQAAKRITHDPELAGIPVVMCSSKESAGDREWGRRTGAVQYFAKPFTAAMADECRTLLERSE